jgi:hypothetical protein
MRDLTKDEITEYLAFAYADRFAADFNEAQAHVLAEAVNNSQLPKAICLKLNVGTKLGIKSRELWLMVWVMGFQMGRECESRLITAALKGKTNK